MKIPKNMTEAEVVTIINKIVYKLAYKFKFGYHDINDMKQQGRLLALEALESNKYDGKRPLENFLWTHVHNRLFNYKRDNFERPDTPCDACDNNINGECVKYTSKDYCLIYEKWLNRNLAKRNLMIPLGLFGIDDEHESTMRCGDDIVDKLIYNEFVDLVEGKLPVVFRKDWILCKAGVHIPKNKRIKLQEIIFKILEEEGINAPETWTT